MSFNRHQISYQLDYRGALNSVDHRIYFRDCNYTPISAWHDIPLLADRHQKTIRLVVTQSRWSANWMMLSFREPLNPIRHNIENNEIKFVPNLYPHHGCPFNFGFIPQTLLPNYASAGDRANYEQVLLCFGEIGERVIKVGEMITAKVLGCFAVIINSVFTWFILVVDVTDPIADLLNDIEDIQKYKPQHIKILYDWFWRFKTLYIDQHRAEAYDNLDFDVQLNNRQLALTRLREAHRMWFEVMFCNKPIVGNLQLTNTTLNNNYSVTPLVGNTIISQWCESDALQPLPVDQRAVSKLYFGRPQSDRLF